MNIAIILAGGLGTRMMRKIPKQFIDIDGKPIIVHTLDKFSNCKYIDKILVVCLNEYIEYFKDLCREYMVDKVEWVISGGKNRHQSIKNAVSFLESRCESYDKIIVHNANMPLISEKVIIECLEKCKQEGDITTTVSLCTGYFFESVNDSLKIGPDREKMLSAKVPDAMHMITAIDLYLKNEYESKCESFTAGMLGIDKGKNVIPIICESTNFKITTEDDYILAKTYLRMKD